MSIARNSAALLFSLMFVGISAAQESQPTSKPVTAKFASKGPQVGTIETLTSEGTGKMDIEVKVADEDYPASESVNADVSTRRREILAVKDGRITELKVTIDRMHTERKNVQEEVDMDSPSVGKTFLLKETEAGVKVTDLEGKDVADDVKKDVEGLDVVNGKIRQGFHALAAFLAEKSIKSGETVEVPEAVQLQLFRGRGQPGMESQNVLKATLKSTQGEGADAVAVLSLDYRRHDKGEAAEVTIHHVGDAVIGLSDAMLRTFKGEGPLTFHREMEQQGASIVIDGKGSSTISVTVKTEMKK
jgi:hypothetical protein